MSENESARETCSIERLSGYLGIGNREIQKLAEQGILTKTGHGKYLVAENIKAYITFKIGAEEDMQRAKLFEEHRKLKHDNDLKAGLTAPVGHVVTVLQPVLRELSSQIDLLPDVAGDACPQVTGKGREDMAKALIEAKNEIANIPDRYLRSVKELNS